jgi:hypothetical protein
MTNRTRKSAALPVKKPTAHLVKGLPGAVFFGAPFRSERWQYSITSRHEESIDYAIRLQRIRSEYESDDCQEMLWHDLSQMGFDSKEIRRFVTNPAAITDCGYGNPIPLR